MTTREGFDPSDRLTRPRTGRTRPERIVESIRERMTAPYEDAPPPGSAGAAINDAVSDAVKTSYDVLSETIAQGRRAAERFRHGEYSVQQVPQEFEVMALRLLDLARQVSTTTFDICEKLLQQYGLIGGVFANRGGPMPHPDQMMPVPPFHEPGPDVAAQPFPQNAPPAATMSLQVRFVGQARGRALTNTLARPLEPKVPSEIHVLPLVPTLGTGAPIEKVTMEADLAGGGMIATITVAADQPPGVYAAMVIAAGQPVPLGSLVIQLEV